MIYLYSTNDKAGAKLIRWGGDDKCSHFAKYYPFNGMVFESRIDTGVRKIPLTDWLKKNRIIYAQEVKLDAREADLWASDMAILGKKYDKKAILFHAFATLMRKWFRWVPYVENKWGDKDHYYCLEVVKTHQHELRDAGMKLNFDMENLYPQEFYEFSKDYDFIIDIDKDIVGK